MQWGFIFRPPSVVVGGVSVGPHKPTRKDLGGSPEICQAGQAGKVFRKKKKISEKLISELLQGVVGLGKEDLKRCCNCTRSPPFMCCAAKVKTPSEEIRKED